MFKKAVTENEKRRHQEEEASARRRAREEQQAKRKSGGGSLRPRIPNVPVYQMSPYTKCHYAEDRTKLSETASNAASISHMITSHDTSYMTSA